ncbi:hypothetical protein FB451DRAFT_1364566 [Mycena latifolia]|nr:hypothetical protein FB451DRAFT_1364566 [Mycena latifolia]
MPHSQLPRELCDFIVDYLHENPPSLGSCALVCRAWVPASRFHLFERISLSDSDGYAAARLNDLLASPHATFAFAVRRLDFHNALAPVQIREPRTGRVHVKSLLEIVPRISQLRQIHTLSLSDLPFEILRSFAKVHMLHLVGITAGPALLRLAKYLPSLTHLTFKRVHAIPHRTSTSESGASASTLANLRHITVRGSSIAFLGWVAALAPCITALDLRDFCPSEVPYLTEYLEALEGSLESLELGLSPGTALREFAWDELAPLLGRTTRLVVCFEIPDKHGEEGEDSGNEGDNDRGESMLRAVFPELQKNGMLEVRQHIEAPTEA